MKRILILLIFCFCVTGSAFAEVIPDPVNQIDQMIYRGTYLLNGPFRDMWIGRASCVQINPAVFVTDAHCLLKQDNDGNILDEFAADQFFLRHPNWGEDYIKVKVAAYDKIKDVAILIVDGKIPASIDLVVFELAPSVTLYEEWTAYGNLADSWPTYDRLVGEYYFIAYDQNLDREWYFTSLKSVKGCSGAPVVDKRGKLVGVIFGHWMETKFSETASFGMVTPVKYIKDVLDQVKDYRGNLNQIEVNLSSDKTPRVKVREHFIRDGPEHGRSHLGNQVFSLYKNQSFCGTAFCVDDYNGYIVTRFSNLCEADGELDMSVLLTLRRDQSNINYTFRIVAYDTRQDLALLQFHRRPDWLEAVRFEDDYYLPDEQEPMVAYGFEYRGLSDRAGQYIDRRLLMHYGGFLYVTSIGASEGFLGSPVFNSRGRMVGMILEGAEIIYQTHHGYQFLYGSVVMPTMAIRTFLWEHNVHISSY